MGSIITLGIDKFELEWGKNHCFTNHSALFLPSDVARIPYYYADDEVVVKDGLSRTLGSIKIRLDLMGYSLRCLPRLYQDSVDSMPDCYPNCPITYDQFSAIIKSINLDNVDLDDEEADYDLGEYVSKKIFLEPEIKKGIPNGVEINNDLGTIYENMDTYIILRLLAENENNLDKLVQWRYTDVIEGGWVDPESLFQPLDDKLKILIVTEGTSDSFIIKRAIQELRPVIGDFFYFADMEENYPFTGTGNLTNFVKGLSRIKLQNNVLVLFDNDTAGVEAFERCLKLDCPNNICICKLPDHKDFKNFKTEGPSGHSIENINGRAVAIESFLDLPESSFVRWRSYSDSLKQYHGVLENKDECVRVFKEAQLTNGKYDTSRLIYLIDYLVDQWVSRIDAG